MIIVLTLAYTCYVSTSSMTDKNKWITYIIAFLIIVFTLGSMFK